MYRKKKRRSSPAAGILITLVLVVAQALLLGLTYLTQLVPLKFLLCGGLILLLCDAIVLVLTINLRREILAAIGIVLALILFAGTCFGIYYVYTGSNTLKAVTSTQVELAEVGVYVSTDSAFQNLNEASDCVFGILTTLDRNNTNETIAQLQSELSTSIKIREFDTVTALADALLKDGEIGAIILNSGYLDLFEDLEGYEDVPSRLREIHTVQVETEITLSQNEGESGSENAYGAAGDQVIDGQEYTSLAVETEGEVFTMYISGIDSRSGLIARSRNDVNIIATVNTATHQILLVNTPRDYFVPLSISGGVCDKLTHAGIYGIDVSMDTMSMLYETSIDYYFRVNFTGFEDIIDALGGITVHSDYSFSSSDGNYSFSAGDNTLYGAAALAFARERHAFSDGDNQRGKNQMAVIKAVINKAISPSLLTGYTSIMESVSGSFETSMPYDVIAGLVQDQLDSGEGWNIVTYSVTGTGDSAQPYSLSTTAYVMVPDYSTVDHAIELMDQVKSGATLTQE